MNLSYVNQPDTSCRIFDYYQSVSSNINKNDGVYKFFKFLKNISIIALSIITAVGSAYFVPQLQAAAAFLGTVAGATVLTKIFSTMSNVKESLENDDAREKVYNFSEMTNDSCSVLKLLGLAHPIFGITNFLSVSNGLIDVKKDLEKLADIPSTQVEFEKSKSSWKEKYLAPYGLAQFTIEKFEKPEEVRTKSMLDLARHTMSLALSIIALAGMFAVLPISEVAIVVASTASILLSFASKVYNDTTSHKMALANATKIM
jgi:hypothetical protein